ncbi:MAG: sugar phosphate isomerase/epimerase [Christensenella sp.]|nr:sugar phosphate isomerase/epimerase [Christensenella sp.]
MKTGMSTACFFCREYNEEAVRKMAGMGIREIELFFSAYMEYKKTFTDEINRICNGEGMTVRSIHALCTQFEPQLFSRHDRQRQEAMDTYRHVLDAAENLGAGLYVFHGAMSLKHACMMHVNYEWAGECVTPLAEQAAERGVKLAYENVHWCWYNRPGFAQSLLKNTDSDNLYFTLDIKQAAQSGYAVEAFLDDMGSRLAHVHLCDYTKDPKKGIMPCLPFSGEVNWQGMKQKLLDMSYSGVLMLEVYPGDYKTYEDLKENYDQTAMFFMK